MRIKIQNFQAVRKADILVHGITLVVGLNNQGKSAIFRAAVAASYGRSGHDFVSHGEKKTIVALEFDADPDNKELQAIWMKGAGGAVYHLNGQRCDSGRRGAPGELRDYGISEIDFSGGKERLMFWRQRAPAFLVECPPTQVFDFISKVLQDRHIIPVMRSMGADISSYRKEAVLCEGEIQTRKATVLQLKGDLDQVQEILSEEDNFNFLRVVLGELRDMKSHEDTLEKLVPQVRELTEVIEAEREPFLYAAEEGVQRISPPLLDLRAMQASEKCLTELKASLKEVRGALESIPHVPEGGDVIWTELKEDCTALSNMEDMKDRIGAINFKLSRIGNVFTSILGDLRDAEEEFEALKQEVGVCPTCGSVLGDGNE